MVDGSHLRQVWRALTRDGATSAGAALASAWAMLASAPLAIAAIAIFMALEPAL